MNDHGKDSIWKEVEGKGRVMRETGRGLSILDMLLGGADGKRECIDAHGMI